MTDLRKPQPDRLGGFRLIGLVAVSAGLLLLAAAAFVLSYAGVHAVALSAGVTPRLARLYPPIFDAMLVIACAAILSLRGAGLPSRFYAWLSLLVLLVAVASADALHATNTALPHRPAAAAAAVIPWALVLIGFGLLVTMLRYGRLRRMAQTAPEDQPIRRGGLAALGFAPEPPALPAGFNTESSYQAVPAAEAAYATEFGPYPVGDQVAAGEAAAQPLVVTAAELSPEAEAEPRPTATAAEPGPEAETEPGPAATAVLEPAAEPQAAPEPDGAPEPGAPPFDRVRSSPVPPES